MALKLVSFSKLKTKMTASTQDVNCKEEIKIVALISSSAECTIIYHLNRFNSLNMAVSPQIY